MPANDVDWLPEGFEVVRHSPPVGSFTVGVPGVGFVLHEKDKGITAGFDAQGHRFDRPVEALGRHGERLERASEVFGPKVEFEVEREALTQAESEQYRSEQRVEFHIDASDPGIVHDRSLD